MYQDDWTEVKSDTNDRKSFIISGVIHLLLLLLLLIPITKFAEIPDEEYQGILVNFGDPDAGFNENEPEEESSKVEEESTANSSNEDILSSTVLDEEQPVKAKPQPKKETKPKTEIKNSAENKPKETKNTNTETKTTEDKKKQYSDLFNKSNGTNNTSRTQGDESGKPDGKALEGISKGSGRVGGGLSGRGVIYEPNFSDKSQKTGKVALTICVDSEGKVIKADFTQKGSTTTDTYLINLAKKTSMQYIFSKSDLTSQCGTVTIDFKVQ
ncbi:MAG: hypothetical protein R2774_14460 [Saprospiraceae bacterium]